MTVKCIKCGYIHKVVSLSSNIMQPDGTYVTSISSRERSLSVRCPKCNGEWGNIGE